MPRHFPQAVRGPFIAKTTAMVERAVGSSFPAYFEISGWLWWRPVSMLATFTGNGGSDSLPLLSIYQTGAYNRATGAFFPGILLARVCSNTLLLLAGNQRCAFTRGLQPVTTTDGDLVPRIQTSIPDIVVVPGQEPSWVALHDIANSDCLVQATTFIIEGERRGG